MDNKLKNSIFKCSYDEYAVIPAVRAGYLNKLSECPANAHVEEEDTAALRFGRIWHTLQLEPEEFKKRYVVSQLCQAILKSGARKGEECDNPGSIFIENMWLCKRHGDLAEHTMEKEVITSDEFEQAEQMSKSINRHPTASELMKSGQPEMTIVWQDEETGLWCKALIDWLPSSASGVVLDLKSTRNCNIFAFNSEVERRGYALSAAMRLEGLKVLKKNYDLFGLIAVQKTPPYRVEVYQLDESWITYGHNKFHHFLKLEKECQEKMIDLINQGKSQAEAKELAYPAYKNAGDELLIRPGTWEADF